MSEEKKIQFLLPNLFTALNMSCGFSAIIYAFQGDIKKALYLIIIGSVFDLFDGKVARWTGTQSNFGEQFDSLSDLISFGVAPSLVFYQSFLSHMGRRGIIFSLIFCLCGSLRLARFNTNIDKVSSDFFEGLPIPAAALALIGFTFFHLIYPDFINSYFALGYILFYSLMMISTVPFYSFKGANLLKTHKKKTFLGVLFLLALMSLDEEVSIFILINVYVFISLIYFAWKRKKFKKGIIELDD